MPKKRKKPGTQKVENRFFLLCEGQPGKSEYLYYQKLIRDLNLPKHKVEVILVPIKKNTGRELVKEAIKLKQIHSDIAWVAYDKDGYTKHPETFALADQKKINIAFSSICFEFWILLHYEYTSKSFVNCADLCHHLKNKHSIDCSKSIENLYELTKEMLNTAISNAKQLVLAQKSAYPEKTPIYEKNPYTNLYELIDDLKKFQK